MLNMLNVEDIMVGVEDHHHHLQYRYHLHIIIHIIPR
jgi:hypothetical protein